ncbi:MAG TPA: hypothetical protein DCP90_03690 [Clostridiales bacterium]|nr:MAG: hypothetical protein A2Y22_06180 [Clostridiales bacterium GWD2_32_59]HAN09697.1 hypothetical protein [Clostridiales bacterium]
MGNIINYYASGNTAKGFYSLIESNLVNLNKLFILKGGPGTGKSTLMKKIAERWINEGHDIEYLHCPSDNDSIDGVINSTIKVGLVADGDPNVVEPIALGASIEYIKLGTELDLNKIESNVVDIVNINFKVRDCHKKAYANFENALKLHDEWEKVYIDNMNFERADSFTDEIIDLLLKDFVSDKKASVKDRFLGAATPEGPKDFIENLTSNISKRYFLKGRPGTGKSTILKKIAKAASDRGADVEVYHCGFDPDSLDMIILRELDVCIFDSTSPHEYFPTKDNDEIIDVYKELVVQGTDEKYKKKLDKIILRYKGYMTEANNFLKEAKELNDRFEAIYSDAMDFSKIDEIRNDLIMKISNLEE